MPLGYEMTSLKHAISGVVQELYKSEADDILNHPWFSKYYYVEGSPPPPLAEWDFTQASAPFLTTESDLPLSQGTGTSVTRVASPWGFAASFPGAGYLKLDAASVGRLNIGAAGGNAVTVAAWINVTDTNIGFIAGCWQENDLDPRRQYGLFYDLDLYGGNDRVCMHASKTGGASPGIPFSRDYSASNQTFTRGSWHFFTGTYDGEQLISYLNGVYQPYLNYTEPGPPNGQSLTYDKNPYLFNLGLNDTPCDFTVGACQTSVMTHHVVGSIAKLRVWDRALSPEEVQSMYDIEYEEAFGPPGPIVSTFHQSASSSADLTTYTFAAQPIGTASATRRVVVAIGMGAGGLAPQITGVTIGGVAATLDVNSTFSGNRAGAIASAVVPTGTTADIVVTLNNPGGRVGIGVWSLNKGAPTGQTDITPNVTSGNLTVTTVADDVVFAMGYYSGASGSAVTAWTGATERYDIQPENTFNSTTGADVVATGVSTSIDFVCSGAATANQVGFVAAAYR